MIIHWLDTMITSCIINFNCVHALIIHLLPHAAGCSQPSRYPLLDQCHVMSLIAEELAGGLSVYHVGGGFNCTLATHPPHTSPPGSRRPTGCTDILCQDSAGRISFTFTLVPCSTLPAIRVAQNDSHGFVVNNTLSKSQTLAVDLDGPVFLLVRIGQHTNQLSLGLEVKSMQCITKSRLVTESVELHITAFR